MEVVEPKHRELNFRKVVESVPPDLLERYFQGCAADTTPKGWATLNGDALVDFLSQPENGG